MLNDTSMSSNYQKVWETMNELEMITSKICSAREIIDAAIDRIQEHQYDKAETMMSAAYEFLEYYLNEFDEKFKLAWKETVVKQKEEKNDAWDAVNSEKEYYEPTMPPYSHSDYDIWCQGGSGTIDYTGIGTPTYYISNQYTDEELNAMCDKAASDEEKEKCLEYNVRESEYYNIDPKGNKVPVKKWVLPVEYIDDEYFVSFPDDLLEAANLNEGDEIEWVDNKDGSYILKKIPKTYDEMIAAGYTMTADGFWIPK